MFSIFQLLSYQPGFLKIILDGVCSVASEEIRMDDWGVDVVLTASQKGLGAPPGLSILVASEKAIKVLILFTL